MGSILMFRTFLKERWHLIVALLLFIVGSTCAVLLYEKYVDDDIFILEMFYHDEFKKSVYLVGISNTDYPPLLVHQKNKPTGLDIDIISWIAREMDIQVAFVPMTWDAIFDALRNGEIDMIMSGASITPERMEVFQFSDPYFPVDQAIAVPEYSSYSLNEFYGGNGTIGVGVGTTSEALVYDLLIASGITDESKLRVVDGIGVGIRDLMHGQFDYFVADQPIMMTYGSQYQIKIIGSISTGEEYGIVFRKDNNWLRHTVNTGLNRLFSSPDWEEMKSKYTVPTLL